MEKTIRMKIKFNIQSFCISLFTLYMISTITMIYLGHYNIIPISWNLIWLVWGVMFFLAIFIGYIAGRIEEEVGLVKKSYLSNSKFYKSTKMPIYSEGDRIYPEKETKCFYCGSELDEDALYCKLCGRATSKFLVVCKSSHFSIYIKIRLNRD